MAGDPVRADDGELRGRQVAGRARYDSVLWRRISDSRWWRWLVGPSAYVLVAVGVAITLFDMELGQSIFVAGSTVAVVVVSSRLATRRATSGESS